MIKIKRIKNIEDLLDALCMIDEDMHTFKLADKDARDTMSKVIDMVRRLTDTGEMEEIYERGN